MTKFFVTITIPCEKGTFKQYRRFQEVNNHNNYSTFFQKRKAKNTQKYNLNGKKIWLAMQYS